MPAAVRPGRGLPADAAAVRKLPRLSVAPASTLQGGITVWLNGPPTLLAHRVVGDGTESRPLLSQVCPCSWGLHADVLGLQGRFLSLQLHGEQAAVACVKSSLPRRWPPPLPVQSGEQSDTEQQQQQSDEYSAAVARLTALLDERQPLYQDADITVSLQGSGPDADIGAPAMEVAYRVLSAINQRIKDDAGGWGRGRGDKGGQGAGGPGSPQMVGSACAQFGPKLGSSRPAALGPPARCNVLLPSRLFRLAPPPCRGAQAAHGL